MVLRRIFNQFGFNILANLVSAMLDPMLAPCISDQDTAHRFCGSGEKVPPVHKALFARQPQICLMNKPDRVKCLPRFFLCEFLSRQVSQFVIYYRQ